MKVETSFEFGDRVKDVVSGFTGTVTGIAKYMTGCLQICLVPETKDNKSEAAWFDDARLVVVERAAVKLPDMTPAPAKGGPVSNQPAAR